MTRERYVLLRSTQIFADLVVMTDAIRAEVHLGRKVDDPLFFKVGSNGKRVFHIAKLKTETEVQGLTFDRQGRLVTCEQGNRRVSRTEEDGMLVTVADKYLGKKLNSPNDVVVRSDGSIYFTDPPYGAAPSTQELDFTGIYRISPAGKLELLIDNVFPGCLP